jgi:hypothetical protein
MSKKKSFSKRYEVKIKEVKSMKQWWEK